MDLLPPLDAELNWSGRGQHAEFKRLERIPLHVEKALGHGGSALVESVLCRRIRLARKRVRCNWRLKREDAIKEVAHLHRAQHAHIVRIVGTYIVEKSKDLFILMYPAAEYHLNDFIDGELDPVFPMTLVSFIPCLASTLEFLHEKHHIKHMDIKPENILVRDIRNTTVQSRNRPYKVYLADFGISRSYASLEESETNSATSFTPLYAAPEVASQDTRGFKADVSALGCVFAEMVAAVYSLRDELADIREKSGRHAFHANISAVQQFLHISFHDAGLFFHERTFLYIRRMISGQPDDRPSAADVKDFLARDGLVCKDESPDAFEVAQPLSEY
ncbi:serine threonine protein kinase [Diplodia corticola]|uniref:Serine threonine protein kinase n=1 Tax=Diplodia corticola TaxID=236234 RepID=A0A1J9S5W7_9PEZI|nr:serine threonine protein kinase [Diplodia corticola]OJD35911.1 serine threonine protein kinase [Diplodia corticola]